MNSDMNQGKWGEIKNMIQAKWGKFSVAEIDSLKGNIDELATKLQDVYGYARAHAEREYHEFRLSLRPILQPLTKTTRPDGKIWRPGNE